MKSVISYHWNHQKHENHVDHCEPPVLGRSITNVSRSFKRQAPDGRYTVEEGYTEEVEQKMAQRQLQGSE